MQDASVGRKNSGTREVTIVEIRNPVTHQKKSGRKYTDFEVCLKTNSKAFTLHKSAVRRRYSDFVWLRSWLSENNEGFSSIRKTPPLPPKKFIGRFEDDFILGRMRGLQKFLRKVIEHNVFLSDKALHLFLQSNLSIRQIENYLTGKPVECDDCSVAARRIMNDGEMQAGIMDQRSLLQRLSWKSSLENISTLHRIAEDSEQSSVGHGKEGRSISNSDGGNSNGVLVGEQHNGSAGDHSFVYESCSSSEGQASSLDADKVISIEVGLSNSLTEDQQHLQCPKSQGQSPTAETTNSVDFADSSRPVMYTFSSGSDTESSGSEKGDPNSSFSIIGSAGSSNLSETPELDPKDLYTTGSPQVSVPDISGRGFLQAVPIVPSPSP